MNRAQPFTRSDSPVMIAARNANGMSIAPLPSTLTIRVAVLLHNQPLLVHRRADQVSWCLLPMLAVDGLHDRYDARSNRRKVRRILRRFCPRHAFSPKNRGSIRDRASPLACCAVRKRRAEQERPARSACVPARPSICYVSMRLGRMPVWLRRTTAATRGEGGRLDGSAGTSCLGAARARRMAGSGSEPRCSGGR